MGAQLLVRENDRARLISRGGHDWARYFPLIVSTALKLRQQQFVIDGEIVVLDKDGVSDFDALHSRKHDRRAQFYAFDLLASDGEDHRAQALLLRKAKLARLLSRGVKGIFIADYEQGARAVPRFLVKYAANGAILVGVALSVMAVAGDSIPDWAPWIAGVVYCFLIPWPKPLCEMQLWKKRALQVRVAR